MAITMLHVSTLLILVLTANRVGAEVYSLLVSQTPSNCRGGEMFDIQPTVTVINKKSQQTVFAFSGTVYATIGTSPSEYDGLYIGKDCDTSSCGELVSGTLASATFFNGMASFQNLALKTAGIYTLKFVGRLSNGNEFAQVFSENFVVSVGEPYKLAFQTFVGTAFGGSPFAANPVVGVVDRGGNVVDWLTAGTITASLTTSPTEGQLLHPVSNCCVDIVNGLAEFSGLYINRTGFPYQITFNSSESKFGVLVSANFDVVTGPPAQLTLVNGTEPSSSLKYGGEFFAVTPQIELRDLGGNLVTRDSTSALKVSLHGNPSGGILGLTDNLFPTARSGIVSLNGLVIDRHSFNYTLLFALYSYSSLTNNYTSTGVTLLSEKFDVLAGPPRQITISSLAGGAWAGNQAMSSQPVVRITDFGGNVLTSDYNSSVYCTLVPSLSYSQRILVDTSNASATAPNAVLLNLSDGTYGAGQAIVVTLTFRVAVWLTVDDEAFPPYVALNAVNEESQEPARALLTAGTLRARTKSLSFTYIVAQGDSVDSLDLSGPGALVLNGSALTDGNGLAVNTTLTTQSLTATHSITINTGRPAVVAAGSVSSNGVYGAGDRVDFFVQFDQPVVVTGVPYVALSAWFERKDAHVVNSSYTVSNSSLVHANATFSHASASGTTLHFSYLVEQGHYTAAGDSLRMLGPSLLFANNTMNTTVVHYWNISERSFYNYTYLYSTTEGGSIRRYSDSPTTLANYSIPAEVLADFTSAHVMTVDTSAPELETAYGVQTSHEDGTFYPGEHILLTVRFTQSVSVFGDGVFLLLDCGPRSLAAVGGGGTYQGFAFVDRLLADNVTLQFLYVVEQNTNCSRLDLAAGGNALRISQQGAYIRRRSMLPSTSANLSTAAIFESSSSLRSSAAIALQGWAPSVSAIYIERTSPQGALVLRPDDSVLVRVNFTAPVFANCSPVLVIAAHYLREAVYVQGNLTSSLLFKYTVAVGDFARNSTAYRNTPYALCPVTGCPSRTRCKILALSSQPTQTVNLRLYKPFTAFDSAVRIGNQTILPVSQHRVTNITSIVCLQSGGVYGPGSVFRFRVEFSDPVRIYSVNASVVPRLLLNTGRYASYAGGNFGKVVTFVYVSRLSDAVPSGEPFLALASVGSTASALSCAPLSHCNITNEAGRSVILTTETVDNSSVTGITLSATPPVVTAVWSDKSASPYSSGAFSQGEVVIIYLQVSRPVLVTGYEPRLLMDVGVEERFAYYNASLSTTRKLAFTYVVGAGESSADLRYSGRSALDLRGGFCEILLLSDIPGAVSLNATLPEPATLSLGSHVIAVDALVAPSVTQVVCLGGSGHYAAGDVLTIRVDFSKSVVAEGHSYIILSVGGRAAIAHYVGYSSHNDQNWTTPSVKAASNATMHLFYQYTVGVDHFSADLDYTDSHALFPGLTDNNDPGYVRDAATFAQLSASLDLPVPGESGSLSADGATVRVDGRAPYITDIAFGSPGGIYQANDSILILVQFSAPVVVVGPPPSLLLETGEYDSEALCIGGNASTTLTFEYIPQPGDHTAELDYNAQPARFNSASDTFLLNGGGVFAASAHPIVPADCRLNPPRGRLQGTTVGVSVAGEVTFDDLYVSRRGPDYLLRFSSESTEAQRVITATQSLAVSFSSEYLLWPNQSLPGHLAGFSVSLESDVAVVGAPNANRSVTSIQAITSAAVEAAQTSREIQAIGTSIVPQPACQLFHTTADVGATLSGTFTVSYGVLGPSSPIPFNADPAMVAAILAFDLPSLGAVTVTREEYIFCACAEAYTWTLTFTDQTEGPFGVLSFDDGNLSGAGAKLVGPIVVQSAALLGGSFTISAFGRTSSSIAYNAGVAEVADAVAELGLTAYDVLITPASASRTRTWSVTFEDYEESYEIPLLSADGSGLTGGEASVWTEITRMGVNGPRGIGGYFQLEWRGNTTAKLMANASAADVKYALEALPVINEVNVNRSYLSDYAGYTWTVEFVSVNINTPRGYEVQTAENLEPIVPISHLIASNVSLNVSAIWAIGDRNQIFSPARLGTYGSGAGNVAVFQRDSNESWIQVASLVGNDTAENSRFGGSVAQSGDVILVGAVGANMNGVPERQSIYCSANDGYFSISFRGWTTDDIPHNVSRLELIHAIVSNTDSFSNLYSVVSIDIDDWGAGGLCDNNTALVTFYAPLDGNTALFDTDTGSDLELLTLTNLNLTRGSSVNDTGILTIESEQNGTWVVHGSNADKQQIGAVYVFRAHYSCDVNSTALCVKSNWTQEAQLFPTIYQQGSRFGAAIAISGDIAVVGAPGTNAEQGYAYVYEYSELTGLWAPLQLIRDPAIANGDRFGTTVAIDAWTMVIGAPHYASDTGAVYIFKRTTAGGTFIASQTLLPSAAYSLSEGNLYGGSVTVSGNLIAIGAPQYDDTSVYLGNQASTEARESSGVVFVFERASSAVNFLFLQKLKPSNVRALDRFGFNVKVDGSSLVASSLESFLSEQLPASRTVMQIRTGATYNAYPVGGFFRLKWLTTSTTNSLSTYTSRAISAGVTAPQLKKILSADFPGIGMLLVSRSLPDQYDGGFAWQVTFTSREGVVHLFEADATLLSGTLAYVNVSFVNPSPPEVRGLVHLFQRDGTATKFVEQLFLTPHRHQAIDRCGHSVSISGKFALVGCPNRDRPVPNHNTGAAFIYHLGLAAVKFNTSSSSAKYEVAEGASTPLVVVHDELRVAEVDEDVLFYLQTVDRNALDQQQTFFRHLYGLLPATYQFPQTAVDTVNLFGLAIGRAQSYGSGGGVSQWLDGMFDYRAIADYIPLYAPHVLLRDGDSIFDLLITAPDTIVELPNELVGLAVWSPGVWPGAFSKLFSLAEIQDSSDGYALSAQYAKLFDNDVSPQSNVEYGSAVSVSEDIGIMATGAPLAAVDLIDAAGKVFLYLDLDGDGGWSQVGALTSPLSAAGNRFGESVVLSYVASRNLSLLVVGEPGANSVHVYRSEGISIASGTFSFEATLTAEAAHLPQHMFGGLGTVDTDGFLLAVGAPGLETVYIYERTFDESTSAWSWAAGQALRSADYDEDLLDPEVLVPHRQGFGAAVSVSGRTVLVGAPHADYGKLGSSLVEGAWATEGTDIMGYGRGKAYVFYGTPATMLVRIVAPEQLLAGEFRLQYVHQGLNETTAVLPFDARETEVSAALAALANIDSVAVSATSSVVEGGYEYTWTVTFSTEWAAPGALTPLWRSRGCGNCSEFSFLPLTGEDQVTVTRLAAMGNITQQQALTASDQRSGDRFGASVAVDGNQIVVGAPLSASMTTTSWDFEAGTLLGWSTSGDAFDFQPTFGDNSYLHSSGSSSLRAKSQATNNVGRYYIGTAEKRPGNPFDFTSPHPSYPQGSTQGDQPMGTLSSGVFYIPVGGSRISFLIGGSCDIYSEYVELVVDGMSVARRTGSHCSSEKLHSAHFDVGGMTGRSAMLRIVDASPEQHINVDSFAFDWDVSGATIGGTANLKVSTGGVVETPRSGAIYMFRRHAGPSETLQCSANEESCVWTQEAVFTPSDKRANMFFGTSVSVNDAAGIVAVGAPGATFGGFYKEAQSVYPYQNSSSGQSEAAGLQFPVESSNMPLFQSTGVYMPERSGAFGVWSLLAAGEVAPDPKAYEQSGAVYIFTKSHATVSNTGIITEPQVWRPLEHAKLQPPDAFARDHFGTVVCVSGNSLGVGSPGQNGALEGGGAAYAYRLSFAAMSFSQVEYAVSEGRSKLATVTLIRDPAVYSGRVVLEYATSDLTARGVDTAKFDECMLLSVRERGPAGCGDYEQSTGLVVVEAGDMSGGFTVRVMDDLCFERFMEYIQVTLAVPGSGALQSERMSAKVRIDDNDFGYEGFC